MNPKTVHEGPCYRCGDPDAADDGLRDEPGIPSCGRCYGEWSQDEDEGRYAGVSFTDWADAQRDGMHEDSAQSKTESVQEDLAKRIQNALEIAHSSGMVDGDHHKMWVIDQMVRVLTGDNYDEWVRAARVGEDGPETYDWDVGIPP